jgi:hypothetical protein
MNLNQMVNFFMYITVCMDIQSINSVNVTVSRCCVNVINGIPIVHIPSQQYRSVSTWRLVAYDTWPVLLSFIRRAKLRKGVSSQNHRLGRASYDLNLPQRVSFMYCLYSQVRVATPRTSNLLSRSLICQHFPPWKCFGYYWKVLWVYPYIAVHLVLSIKGSGNWCESSRTSEY